MYGDLATGDVEHVATVVCGGDVYNPRIPSLSGLHQDILQCSGRCRTVRATCARVHTRLVMKEVRWPLLEYLDTKELAVVMRGAITGTAWGSDYKLDGRLH